MKKMVVVAMCTVVLISCRKQYDHFTKNHVDPQSIAKCGNNLNAEVTAKMIKALKVHDKDEKLSSVKPKHDPDPALSPAIIFLDTDGHTVENTLWNGSDPFTCADAGLTEDQLNAIIKTVTEDFSTFNIIVTDDARVFDAAPKEKRMRVIITLYQGLNFGFPIAGGYAFIGSLWWNDDTPCFVFSDALSWNVSNIAEAVSHEAGHTIGLYHQAEFSFDGQLKYEYHTGFFSVPFNIYWKPIMGGSYNGDISGWMSGRTLQGFQNDSEILSAVGVQNDELSNDFENAETLKFAGPSKQVLFSGLMNKRSDADYFVINTGNFKFSIVGGGNCDIQVTVYDADQQLIKEYNDAGYLGISEKTMNMKSNKIYFKVSVNGLLIGDLWSEPQLAGQYSLLVKKI